MGTPNDEESYYTSLRDSIAWSLKFLGSLVVGLAVIGYLRDYFRGHRHGVTLKAVLATLLVAICSGLFLGTLLFCFGWLGRVTISRAGLKAPLYSGRRVFLAWEELQTAQKGSLSGWPCILVAGADSKAPLFLMVLGEAKQQMIEGIRNHAGADNALMKYLHGQVT